MAAYRKRSATELRTLSATITKILDNAKWEQNNKIWHATITYYKNDVPTSLTRSGSLTVMVRRVLWDYLVNMGKSGAKILYERGTSN